MTAAPAIACLQRMPSRPIRNGLAHLGSASLCSVQQPACAMRRTVCRLRAITAAVTYVTQPISWKPRKSSGVLGYAAGRGVDGFVSGFPSFSFWFTFPSYEAARVRGFFFGASDSPISSVFRLCNFLDRVWVPPTYSSCPSRTNAGWSATAYAASHYI